MIRIAFTHGKCCPRAIHSWLLVRQVNPMGLQMNRKRVKLEEPSLGNAAVLKPYLNFESTYGIEVDRGLCLFGSLKSPAIILLLYRWWVCDSDDNDGQRMEWMSSWLSGGNHNRQAACRHIFSSHSSGSSLCIVIPYLIVAGRERRPRLITKRR